MADGSNNGMRAGADECDDDAEPLLRTAAVTLVDDGAKVVAGVVRMPFTFVDEVEVDPPPNLRKAAAAAASRGVRFESVTVGVTGGSCGFAVVPALDEDGACDSGVVEGIVGVGGGMP